MTPPLSRLLKDKRRENHLLQRHLVMDMSIHFLLQRPNYKKGYGVETFTLDFGNSLSSLQPPIGKRLFILWCLGLLINLGTCMCPSSQTQSTDPLTF
jgi:hypothetical protein